MGFSALRGGQKFGIFSSKGGNFAVQDLATLQEAEVEAKAHEGRSLAEAMPNEA